MTLVDDLHGEIHTADLLPQATRGIHRDYGRVLSELVGCGMESASSLAAVQAADVGLVMVLEAIEAARPLSEEHARTLERAARQLGKEAA